MNIIRKILLAIPIFNFGFALIANEEDRLNLKNLINEYYTGQLYYFRDSQKEFKIKELIKNLRESKFSIKKDDIEQLKIKEKKDINLKDTNWKIEKLYFTKVINVIEPVLSPEPNIKREYYIVESDFIENGYKKALYLKGKELSIDIYLRVPQVISQASSKIVIEFDYFLFGIENFEDKFDAINDEFREIIYKIYFIQDTSPYNNFERKIRIFGNIEDVK